MKSNATGSHAGQIDFAGKVAVVTGAASGIGAATATLLAELGAAVALLDINTQQGEELAHAICAAGGRATFHACDVRSQAAVEQAVSRVEQQYGLVSLLVSSAGVQRYGTVLTSNDDVWNETMQVHVNGCFHAVRACIPQMIQAGGGAIVVVGSVQTYAAVQNSVAYVAAKHALLGIVRAVALDHAAQGIRANCVLPGAIDTPMLRWAADRSGNPQAVMDASARMRPLRRVGQPLEVARPIAFLLSDWASFITGAPLLVDGGVLVPAGGMGLAEGGTGAAT